MKQAVQEKAQVARTFMIKPMGPVWLMVSISMKATRIEMMAAEGEAADADHHVLEVEVQKHDAGHQLGQEHHDVGDAGEHGDAHHGLGVHLGTGGGLDCGRCGHKKHSFLFWYT